MNSVSSGRVVQRSPQGEEWVVVPCRGNVEVGMSTPKIRITHVLEIFPENRAIVKTRRRSALGAEVAERNSILTESTVGSPIFLI